MTRRGLTLIETLMATVILSASAAVCASMLRSARASLETPRHTIRDLAALADAVLEDPESFGIEKSSLSEIGSISLQWPESIDPQHNLTAALVSVAKSTDSPANVAPHAWLMFEHDGLAVIRYLVLPEDEE